MSFPRLNFPPDSELMITWKIIYIIVIYTWNDTQTSTWQSKEHFFKKSYAMLHKVSDLASSCQHSKITFRFHIRWEISRLAQWLQVSQELHSM